MLRLLVLAALAWPAAAHACDRPVCRVDPASLRLSEIVGFDGQPSGLGPGRDVRGLLTLEGASFGERFAGQRLERVETFDHVDGPAEAPLTLLAGADWHNLSVLRMPGLNVLSGDGPEGYPKQAATGEGAIAILFARDQAALRLWLRGGEGGTARVQFLARDGAVLDLHEVAALSEDEVGFVDEQGRIAGLVLTNRDPEGIALARVEFGSADRFSALAGPPGPG